MNNDEAVKETIKSVRSTLIKIAASLAVGEYTVSEYQEDHTVKVPVSVLHKIGKQNDRLRSVAARLKAQADALSATENAGGGWLPISK